MLKKLYQNQLYFYSIIAVIIYLVGIVGITCIPELFKPVTPLNLLLSALFILYFDKSPRKKILFFAAFTFITGWIIEWIGVYSKLIFGEYQYGPTLGLAIDGIPVLIGINWFILSYYSANLSEWIFPKTNIYLKTTFGAFLMVVIDAVIEPLCGDLDFWYWKGDHIPMQNFIAWLIFSWGYIFLFYNLKLDSNNKASRVLYVIQLIFFLALFISFKLIPYANQ
ncbi:carotenoid biosynthesis protein [Cytophaga aurantiaca]|uniref:carotenoid biosynthesis protein n=1 Tax=Cytophaga aurantiaca TaxID=29530 RepID=UPI00036DC5C8|nr:carotenoid biosynthesis protein [Cytophaga aurantiaca]